MRSGGAIVRPTISSASLAGFASFRFSRPTTAPLRSMEMVSAIRITSSSLWEMKMTALLSDVICLTTWKRASASCGVKTLVGSSRIRISAPWIRALRISTRCRSPGESCHTLASGLPLGRSGPPTP